MNASKRVRAVAAATSPLEKLPCGPASNYEFNHDCRQISSHGADEMIWSPTKKFASILRTAAHYHRPTTNPETGPTVTAAQLLVMRPQPVSRILPLRLLHSGAPRLVPWSIAR